jgi:Fic family protein
MRYIDWIKTEEWTWTRVAEEIGVANATAARRFAHGTIPSRDVMDRIVRRSGGRVTSNDFYGLESETERHRSIMDELLARIAAKKAELDRLRPTMPGALANFERVQDLELTYTSNAIEGNTLTGAETALVIEHGITIGGKPLKDHLEAVDHHEAIAYVRALARQSSRLIEADIRNLHRLVVQRSNSEIAGSYADQGRYVLTDTGRRQFPSPAEIPALMDDFVRWLAPAPDVPETAFAAHRRLVDIHPFNDGNGRVARLVMNLILIRGGYPPVAIRPDDRLRYIRALQEAQEGRDTEEFDRLL